MAPVGREPVAERPDASPAPRAVVLRALGLGDLLTAVPALRGLRRALPDHRIELAAPAALAPLVALSGAVDETVDVPSLVTLPDPVPPLPARLHGAEVAVNLHGAGPQSHELLRAARPGRLMAFACRPFPDGPAWDPDEHEVVRWCRMLGAHGVPCDPHDLLLPRPDGHEQHAVRGAVVLHPGAASGARRWPVERFAAVARALAAAGERVLVTGSPAEADLAADLARRAGLPADACLAGRTDVLGLATVVADAACVVAGDTGVAHVATAMGTPSVLLFGPTPPTWWGPPIGRDADAPRHVVLWAGRTGDPHADAPDPGLLEITPEGVLDGVRRARAAGPAR